MALTQLKFDWKNTANKNAWEKCCEGNMDFDSDDCKSLLEIVLKSSGYDKHKLVILERIKASMVVFWSDRTINYPKIERKDITHCRRIIYNIERILIPMTNSNTHVEDTIDCIFDLDYDDIFVLLCSIYLHDYGKGQFRLTIPHLEKVNEEFYNTLKNTTHASDINKLEEYNIIEEYHTYNFNEFLNIFLIHQSEDEFARKAEDAYPYTCLKEYFKFIMPDDKKGPDEEKEEILYNQLKHGNKDAGTAQKLLFRQLWTLRHLFRRDGMERPLLKEIKIISCSHKPYRLLDNTGNFSGTVDYFDEIKNENEPEADKEKLSLLAALLRIGDNLDITKERVENDALKNLMVDWMKEGSREILEDAVISLFAVWLKFMLVDCDIRHNISKGQEDTGKIQIEIVIKYRRFTNWQKHFYTIRNMVEKDFLMTNYLHRLNQEKDVKLLLLYELVSHKKKKFDIAAELKIEGQMDKLFEAKKTKFKKDLNKYQLVPEKDKGKPETMTLPLLEFSPLPPGISLPTNRSLLYLLSYLKNVGPTPCGEIAASLGISEFEHLDHKDAVNEGNLLKVEATKKTVSVTEGADPDAKVFMKVYQQQRNLVRQKVRELEVLGSLLPFSQKEPDVISTGIEGLDGILNPYRQNVNSVSGFKLNRNILIVGEPGTGKTTLLLQILHWTLFFRQRNVLMLTFEENPLELEKTFEENFGWKINNLIQSIRIPIETSPQTILINIHKKIEEEQPELVFIDGLSRLESSSNGKFRDLVHNFFSALQMKGITGIFSIEEPTDAGPYIGYQADGIVHLHKSSEGRELEIKKLRSQDFITGCHAFEIIDKNFLENSPRLFWYI